MIGRRYNLVIIAVYRGQACAQPRCPVVARLCSAGAFESWRAANTRRGPAQLSPHRPARPRRPGGTGGGRGRGGGRGGDLRHAHTILRPVTVGGAEATRQTGEVRRRPAGVTRRQSDGDRASERCGVTNSHSVRDSAVLLSIV